MDRKEEIYLLYHWNIDGLSNTKAIKMTYLRLQNVKSGSRRKQADWRESEGEKEGEREIDI